MSADTRRIEVALGRVQEVWTRLGIIRDRYIAMGFENFEDFPLWAEMRCSLLAAMTELQALLPAERGSEWAAKVERAQ